MSQSIFPLCKIFCINYCGKKLYVELIKLVIEILNLSFLHSLHSVFVKMKFLQNLFLPFLSDLICQKLFMKNEENPTSYVKHCKFQRKHAKSGHDSQRFVFRGTKS